MFFPRIIRRRCSFRNLLTIVILLLVLVSIQLSLFSNQTLNFFGGKNLLRGANRDGRGIDYVNIQGKYNISRESLDQQHSRTSRYTWEEIRRNPSLKTGNPHIDNYGKNDVNVRGENGKGVKFAGEEKEKADALIHKFNLNVYASDRIPLNRYVPDSRFKGCQTIPYKQNLPSASIIIPFYDEWPTILLRTIYSVVNRSPKQMIKEIILVDDGSKMIDLKENLDRYVEKSFPPGLIKILRQPERKGLIQSRLAGYRNSTGDVLIFFDSHMEVNIDWLQPLLMEVQKDRTTVALGTLDYIQLDTLEYKFYDNYMTRYAFDWRLVFFETFFRNDQVGARPEDTRPGTVMVGAAYAIDRSFFEEIGTYDEGMQVWGGENLEMAWRIWLCGGRLVHVPCSHIGHVARSQPYSFPGGREAIEMYNYKRAIEVWMEPEHKELVYNYFPNMRTLDVGDLSERIKLKERLQCKPFSWFMENIWPELMILSKDVTAWGSARNLNTNKCLDNHSYLFQAAEKLFVEPCHYQLATQGFSMTRNKRLRTSLQCVVVKDVSGVMRPMLEDCIIGPQETWIHRQGDYLKHEKTGLCMDLDDEGPVMKKCDSQVITQLWQFNTYVS